MILYGSLTSFNSFNFMCAFCHCSQAHLMHRLLFKYSSKYIFCSHPQPLFTRVTETLLTLASSNLTNNTSLKIQMFTLLVVTRKAFSNTCLLHIRTTQFNLLFITLMKSKEIKFRSFVLQTTHMIDWIINQSIFFLCVYQTLFI